MTRPSSFWLNPLLCLTCVWVAVGVFRELPFFIFPSIRADVLYFGAFAYGSFLIAYLYSQFVPIKLLRKSGIAAEISDGKNGLSLSSLVVGFAVIGLVGSVSRGVDMFFLRGIDFSEGFSAARLSNMALVEETGVGTRPLSVFGKLLMSCSTVAVLAAFLRAEVVTRSVLLSAAISWVVLMALSVLEGGRNTIVVNLVMFAAAGIVRRGMGLRFAPFGMVVRWGGVLSLVVVAGYILYIFIDRFQALGYTDETVFAGIESLYGITVSPWIKEMPAGAVKSFIVSIVMVLVYVSHGIDQIGLLIDWLKTNGLGYGRYNLDLVVIALERLGASGLRYDFNLVPSPGLYFTALGELLLDFGQLGTIVLIAMLGFLVGSAWRLIKLISSIYMELFLCFVLGGLVVSPLYCIVPGFLGVFISMIGFGVIGLVQRAFRYKNEA